MKRNWLPITCVLLVMVSILLTGCGGPAEPVVEEPTEAATEEVAVAATEEAEPIVDDSWSRIQEAGKIVVGTSADYPPFEFVNEDNEFDGFDMALIREVSNALGVEVEIQDIAFDGLIAALKAGQIDAIIAAMSATPERDKEVDFTINYYVGTDAILIKEGSALAFESAEDIAAYKVGVQAGTIHETWVQDTLLATGAMDEANLSRYERAELAISDLKNGRIDVVAMDYFAAKAYVEQGGIVMALEQNLSGENMAIAVREGSTALQEQLNGVIEGLQDSGVVDTLAEEYLGGEVIDAESSETEAVTGPVWEKVLSEGKLVVGTSADYPPFEFINEDNEFDGFDMALIKEIGNRLGVEVELQDIAFDGLIAALKAGQIDAIIAAMSATPDRDKEVDFTVNYYVGTDAILIKEGSDLVLESADDMAGYKIGVQSGTLHDTWVQENLVDTGKTAEADVSRYERAELAISDLKNGRVEVVAMDYFAAKAYIEQGGIVMALEQNLSGENMAIAVREGAEGIRWNLEQVILELQEEGFIDQLAEEYLAGESVE
ncbi:MAG: transporter substrate-binding domain-containing protein [Anaerolineae bacterium]|nr:transporter substrate-binding domain-containing protein [Anaerolineae bacterium]